MDENEIVKIMVKRNTDLSQNLYINTLRQKTTRFLSGL